MGTLFGEWGMAEALEIPISPSEELRRAARDVKSRLPGRDVPGRSPELLVRDPSGREVRIALGDPLYGYLFDLLAAAGEGHRVLVIPPEEYVSETEAARILNVSAEFVVRLAAEGKLRSVQVGPRLLVKKADLLEYKQKDDADREAALRELTELGQEMGLGY